MNEFISKIDQILKNHPLPRHNTAADRELPEDLPEDLPQGVVDRQKVSGSAAAAKYHPSPTSTMAPKPSCSSASATSSCRWPTGRTTSPPPASSPAPATPLWHPRHTAGPGGSHTLLPCRPSPTVSAYTTAGRN
jgi:hypothetical protein